MSNSGSSSPENEECYAELGALPYTDEPEYTEEELRERRERREADAAAGTTATSQQQDPSTCLEEEYHWPPPSRVGNTEWCECSCCVSMPARLDCICCRESLKSLEMINSRGAGEAQCITELEVFRKVCLDKDVLETALYGYLDTTKRTPSTSNFDNK